MGYIIPIQSRIKSFVSISEKHSSKRFNINKSILELQDLVGIRLILLFKPDIEEVIGCVKANFNIIKEYNAEDKLEYNQFGYSSKHVIISLSDNWLSVPTFKDLSAFSAEVQIRTMSQHIWAESSTLLQYKTEQNVPKVLLRSIGRISALLETVDLEYERLLMSREGYIQKIEIENESELNVDTLKLLLNKTLPNDNLDGNEDYSSVLIDITSLNINSLPELEKMINENLPRAVSQDKQIVDQIAGDIKLGRISDYNYNIDRQEKGVFFNHIGLIRSILDAKYGKKWKEIFNKINEGKKSLI